MALPRFTRCIAAAFLAALAAQCCAAEQVNIHVNEHHRQRLKGSAAATASRQLPAKEAVGSTQAHNLRQLGNRGDLAALLEEEKFHVGAELGVQTGMRRNN
jgi:hypothetical protein